MEAFRRAGFKDRAADGAASELGRREWASETEGFRLGRCKTVADGNAITARPGAGPGQGRNEERAPARGERETWRRARRHKQAGSAALGEMHTDAHPPPTKALCIMPAANE